MPMLAHLFHQTCRHGSNHQRDGQFPHVRSFVHDVLPMGLLSDDLQHMWRRILHRE